MKTMKYFKTGLAYRSMNVKKIDQDMPCIIGQPVLVSHIIPQ
jgi:hypothetical protein